jgi:hypothetical protein
MSNSTTASKAPAKSATTATPTAATAKNQVTKKCFVIRKSLIGTNTVISFVNAKKELKTYDHDLVYNALKARFDLMPCFAKYGSYTNSKDLPVFVRTLPSLV